MFGKGPCLVVFTVKSFYRTATQVFEVPTLVDSLDQAHPRNPNEAPTPNQSYTLNEYSGSTLNFEKKEILPCDTVSVSSGALAPIEFYR